MSNFEARNRGGSAYWTMFVKNSRAEVDFNVLFRQFHQYCSVPDEVGIRKVCEPKLAEAVN